MTFNTIILQPQTQETTFNKDYFLNTHIPLAKSEMERYGLKSIQVILFPPKPDNTPSEYYSMTTLTWESSEDMTAAMSSPEGAAVFQDGVNCYSGGVPVVMAGPVVAQ